jgi:hypothetical protein
LQEVLPELIAKELIYIPESKKKQIAENLKKIEMQKLHKIQEEISPEPLTDKINEEELKEEVKDEIKEVVKDEVIPVVASNELKTEIKEKPTPIKTPPPSPKVEVENENSPQPSFYLEEETGKRRYLIDEDNPFKLEP